MPFFFDHKKHGSEYLKNNFIFTKINNINKDDYIKVKNNEDNVNGYYIYKENKHNKILVPASRQGYIF